MNPPDSGTARPATSTASRSRPLVIGIGGTSRAGSSTERALVIALRSAAEAGAQTRLFGGQFLASLPSFSPGAGALTPEQAELADAVERCQGIIIASPGYHGAISGLVKNALDSLESLANKPVPYFHGRPVGTLITAAGWQAAGTTLGSLRAIIHAMRGWPTPFGAALNSAGRLFDEAGECVDQGDAAQIRMMVEQVMDFIRMRQALEAQSA